MYFDFHIVQKKHNNVLYQTPSTQSLVNEHQLRIVSIHHQSNISLQN